MDTSIAAGTRSSAQAIAFAQKRAMPKQILPVKLEAPVKMPETSVQQLRQRADAESASQRLHAPKDSIQKDIVADREGILVARRRAAQRMDFAKFDAHAQADWQARQGKARQGEARRGKARQGEVRRGEAR